MSAVLPQRTLSMSRLLWFRDPDDVTPFINETAVRIRAGIMLAIPVFMAFTLVDIVFGTRWIVTGNLIRDTFDTDFDGRILYMVEAVRRTYDYSVQTGVLFYALFEMLAGTPAFSGGLAQWLMELGVGPKPAGIAATAILAAAPAHADPVDDAFLDALGTLLLEEPVVDEKMLVVLDGRQQVVDALHPGLLGGDGGQRVLRHGVGGVLTE